MRDPGLVESIRESLDIVQIISEVVPLEKRGHNHFGCCPFHKEKTPSFSVSSDKQLFHCFGCKVGGDVFKFCTLYYKWEFPQAIEELARKAGISYQPSGGPSESWKESLEILEVASQFFEDHLFSDSGAPARDYLQTRKIPERLWKEFRLGYHPGGYTQLVQHLESKSLDRDKAARLGLIGKGNRGDWIDRFRGRLIFSISDDRGHIRGFGARALGDEQPKYINSPGSPVFDKSKLLYGMHLASDSLRKKDYVVIVEGYLDVLALHEYGMKNVVCPMGTALTRDQVRQIKRWTQRVVCLFDEDSAGIQATERNLEAFLEEGMESKVAHLEGAKDPDAFLHGSMPEDQKKLKLAASFKKAEFALDFLIRNNVLAEKDAVQRAKKVRLLVELLDKVPDAIERGVLKRELAKKFDLPRDLFLRPEEAKPAPNQAAPRPQAQKRGSIPSDLWEREILKFLVLWGKSANFALTELRAYLSFPSKWSKTLGDLIEAGKSSQEIAELRWLDQIDSDLQSEIREWILLEESIDQSKLAEIWSDLQKRLRNTYFKHQSLRLQSEIVEAEKEGNLEKMTRLLSEKQDLARMLKSFEG